jgi:hypothetical protein
VGNIGAISVAESDPNVIYVGTGSDCIRGNVSVGRGVWETMDGGATWDHVLLLNDSTGSVSLAMNPANPRGLYAGMWRAARKPWTLIPGGPEGGLYETTDGGDTFQQIPVHHGDVHDLWINPQQPEIFVVGDDGGADVTLNGGRTFSGVYNQPTAELYDVMLDNGHPCRIYGSQQDNTTISVLAHRMGNTLRPQEEWRYAAGCETGPIAFDPDDPDVIWGGCYGGGAGRRRPGRGQVEGAAASNGGRSRTR